MRTILLVMAFTITSCTSSTTTTPGRKPDRSKDAPCRIVNKTTFTLTVTFEGDKNNPEWKGKKFILKPNEYCDVEGYKHTNLRCDFNVIGGKKEYHAQIDITIWQINLGENHYTFFTRNESEFIGQ